jgi:penicillin amidase
MISERTRRAILAAIGGLGVGSTLSPTVERALDRFAPLSGSVWDAANRELSRTVESEYGHATLRYDDYGVPHVEGESEAALYFGVGYAQAADRLLQLDLVRRTARGRLSAIAGERTVESDELYLQLDLPRAARASWTLLEDETRRMLSAFADGVNAYIERETLPLGMQLLGDEPEPWTPVDSLLMSKLIAMRLTFDFDALKRRTVADRLGSRAATELFPDGLDHEYPILREGIGGSTEFPGGTQAARSRGAPGATSNGADGSRSTEDDVTGFDPAFLDWLSQLESPNGIGSNSWLVSGTHTESGRPILCNDPHVDLSAPPLWYEQHLETEELSIRGAALPGIPFIVTGENQAGAWGITNAYVEVLDTYTYDVEGDEYRYGDEMKSFETQTKKLPVAGGTDRTVEFTRTVHGPVLEREDERVGVAWTGLTGTRTMDALRRISLSEGLDDVLDAARRCDTPTQNVVYASRDGRTAYILCGLVPYRGSQEDPVRGDQVFDGSEREGEWPGYVPYGRSDFSKFVDFEDKPIAIDPDYIATANQKIVEDPGVYLTRHARPPYRAQRIYDMIEGAIDDGESIDRETMMEMQRDTRSELAADLVPELLDQRDAIDDAVAEELDVLADWDYEMDRDSRGALLFSLWFEEFQRLTFEPQFEPEELDESYWPDAWVLATLPADSQWFDDPETDTTERRGDVIAAAFEAAVRRIDEEGHDTYGDVNEARIEHQLGLSFLRYPHRPTDGSGYTIRNFWVDLQLGSSWRMIAPLGENSESSAILAGGNSGDYFSEHYSDQFSMWNAGEYKSMARTLPESIDVEFGGDGS